MTRIFAPMRTTVTTNDNGLPHSFKAVPAARSRRVIGEDEIPRTYRTSEKVISRSWLLCISTNIDGALQGQLEMCHKNIIGPCGHPHLGVGEEEEVSCWLHRAEDLKLNPTSSDSLTTSTLTLRNAQLRTN
jgi:hypothetical protein